MRILIVSWKDVANPLPGGSEVLVDRLAQGLHERGHDVTLLCGGPVGEHDYAVLDAGSRLGQFFSDPFVARRHFGDVDVVVDVCNGLPFWSPLWSRAPVVSLVNHIHRGMWREWFSPAVAWAGHALETKVMPRVYRKRLVVAVSRSTADDLVRLGLPEHNIRVVHNGVDLHEHAAERAIEPSFVAVGRLVPHKRFDLMLRAWARVRPHTGGTLTVAGEGPLRAELERSAPPGTRFTGHVSDHEKRELLTEAWALVQPSRLEGWGLVVMEAAACATPTIGFDVPGTRDAVVHDETGLLVHTEDELVDAWIALTRDHEHRRVLAKGARRRAEHFSWDRTVGEFEAVLGEAVAAAPVRPKRRRTTQRARETKELARLFFAEKHDPEPFYKKLAERSIADFSLPLEGRRILDLGSGPGHYTEALRGAGAEVHPVELDFTELAAAGEAPLGATQADATQLPFGDATFDGVFCSNMLEHTPSIPPVLREIGRVMRPGGWGWISWTNWYSPWGGHEIVPLHYLGPERGLRLWRRLFGEPRKNVPFVELWPTYIGQVLKMVDAEPSIRLRDSMPRYYPSQRWITRVPGVREVLTWNCVLVVERT